MIDKPFVEFDSDAVRLVTEKRDIFMNYSFYLHFFEHFSKAKALSLMEHFSGIFSESYFFFSEIIKMERNTKFQKYSN